MPSPALIPHDELLAPIRVDEPAGDSVPFAVRQKLEEHRKEINPNDFAPDDPLRPTDLKRADWPAIVALTQETLRKTSKDLLVAARLTEALTKLHGFAGLRDGLVLLRRMVADCWDRIQPVIEDDIEVRAAAFNWLDDPDRGARFPSSVRKVTLVRVGEEEGYGWFTWKQVQDGRGQVTGDQFEKAVMNTPVAFCQLVVEDLRGALGELDQLTEALTARMADAAPSLSDLRKAMDECQTLAQQIRQRKGPVLDSAEEAPAAAPAAAAAAPAAGGGGGGGAVVAEVAAPARAMRTRADVYRQLNEAANLLQQMEPHSPIPYLILKAVELGGLPFPQLMKALIRNDDIITEMNRELGIKDGTPPAAEE